jgi:hypothetical protein
VRPHESTAMGHSMRFVALPITPTVLRGPGFSNPDQAWALMELPAAEPPPEALLTPDDERSMPARVSERIPTRTHEPARESTTSPVPSSAPLPWTALRGT